MYTRVLNFKIFGGIRAARACDAFHFQQVCAMRDHEASWSTAVIYNKVGANAAHLEFHSERPLIAVPSLLEGAVAPHRGAASAF